MATDDELDDARVVAAIGRFLQKGAPFDGLPFINQDTRLFPDDITAAVRATPLAAAAAAQAKADAAVPATEKGAAEGVAELDEDSLVPAAQIPMQAVADSSELSATFVAVEGEPSDGDAIVWDESAEHWVPAAVEGGGALSILPEAEGDAGVATTARAISAARLKQQIEEHGITVIPGAVVRGVIVVTGAEARPSATVVVWVNPDSLVITNKTANDIEVNPADAASTAGIVDAKGDLLVGSAADTLMRLGVGANGKVLVADDTQSSGMRWGDASGGVSVIPDIFPVKPGGIGYSTLAWAADNVNVDASVFGNSGQRLFLEPLDITTPYEIDQLRIWCEQGGNGVIRFGLYDHNPALGTINRLVQGSVSAVTGGEHKIATVATGVLSVGRYWLAIGSTDTTGTVRVTRGGGAEVGPNYTTFRNHNEEHGLGAYLPAGRYDGQDLSAGLPATLSLASGFTGQRVDIPVIHFRRKP